MTRFVILLSGPINPTPDLRDAAAGCRCIAADAGIDHAAPLGLTPELWVGDFDSTTRPREAFPNVPVETFPTDKDRTDGEIAVEAAIDRGASALLLVGALRGPRSDHAFSNLILALRYAARGLDVELFDGQERGWPLKVGGPARTFPLAPGAQFSILKFTDLAGLTIRGARYPLDAVEVPFHSILTQSNEALGPVEVALGAGTAILLAEAQE